MNPLPILKLIMKRLADDWMLLASIFAGITLATTLVVAAPVYLKALERLALNMAIDRPGRSYSNITTFGFNIP